jgi:DNA-binding transcriptional regulator YiaG
MSRLAYEARRATGLSQRAFARLIDVHPATVARWETGEREPTPATRTLLRLIVSGPATCAALLRAQQTARA